ncbi:MAG: NAD-dependent epimerase/dehydratase family protein [Ignavibacteriaceae bacterium]
MQTILGAGGAAGTELAKELGHHTSAIRIVNRNPERVNSTDELMKADLSVPAMLDKAVEGSEIVYVTLGFEYKTRVWKEKWPAFMSNLIKSCHNHQARIVFVDNMYMYDKKYLSNMTESTPVNPTSEKGKVREKISYMLMDAVERGDVKALIARGADFYGPGVQSSYLTQTVYNNLKKGKNPQWLGKLDVLHNFTYSRDIGKALIKLGNYSEALNQVWHLPTYQGKMTSREWINLLMKEMNVNKNISSVPVSLMGLLGIFIPVLKELKDIGYQVENDYFFNSEKFIKAFNFSPTTPEEGIREMIKEETLNKS